MFIHNYSVLIHNKIAWRLQSCTSPPRCFESLLECWPLIKKDPDRWLPQKGLTFVRYTIWYRHRSITSIYRANNTFDQQPQIRNDVLLSRPFSLHYPRSSLCRPYSCNVLRKFHELFMGRRVIDGCKYGGTQWPKAVWVTRGDTGHGLGVCYISQF